MLFGHFSLVRNVNCTMSKFFGVVVIAWFVCDIDAVYIFVRNGFVCVYSIWHSLTHWHHTAQNVTNWISEMNLWQAYGVLKSMHHSSDIKMITTGHLLDFHLFFYAHWKPSTPFRYDNILMWHKLCHFATITAANIMYSKINVRKK